MPNQEYHKLKAFSNCWICEGWTEARFEFLPGITYPKRLGEFENIYLHFSFEGYKPDLMSEDNMHGPRYLYRMLPAGRHYYFFSIDNERMFVDPKADTKRMRGKLQVVGIYIYIYILYYRT